MSESQESLRTIFLKALEIGDREERSAYLEQACGEDEALRVKIGELIGAHPEAGGFLGHETSGSLGTQTMESSGPESRAGTSRWNVSSTEKPGEMIDRYKLLQKIGEGGYGTVYMAEQEEPVRRRVALKVIKLGMDTKEVIARFEAERQALAMMDHPNIARVLDAGATDTGRPYFVMELVRGIRITDYCNQNHLNLDQRLDLFIKVSQAIQHAHQKGIIHRDIKPSNILVTLHDGVPVPKVIDFGIAKATEQKLTDKTLFTQFEAFIGTPAYTSPEQAEMSGLDIDTRTDIYALGVLLYELLTGKTPFDGKELIHSGLEAMRRTIREKEPPRPSTRVSTLVGEELTTLAKHHGMEVSRLKQVLMGDLDWIVMKCLEKDRTRRYVTANGLAADLQRYLNDELVEARPPSRAYRMQKFVRRHKMGLGVAVGVGMVLVGATGLSTWMLARTRAAEEEVRMQLQVVEAERDAKVKALVEAESISQFMNEVFQSSDPARDGRTIMVAETLDKAAEKLEGELADQPARRAMLRVFLGQTYHSLGLYESAIGLLESARDFYQANSQINAPLCLRASRVLATCYHEIGGQEEREKVLEMRRELLARFQEVYGLEHPETILMLTDLAWSYWKTEKFEEAKRLHQELVGLNEKVNGAGSSGTLLSRARLINIGAGMSGQHHEAVGPLKELLPLFKQGFGLKHPETVNLMFDLAFRLQQSGQINEALEISLEALELSKEVNGPEHLDTLLHMGLVGGNYMGSGECERAVPILEEAVMIYRKQVLTESSMAMGTMCTLAKAYHATGRDDLAKALMREIKMTVSSLPIIDLRLLTLLFLANESLGEFEDAIEYAREILKRTRENNLAPEIREVTFLTRIANLYVDWAKQERVTNAVDALDHARQGVELLEQAIANSRDYPAKNAWDSPMLVGRLAHAILLSGSLTEFPSPAEREVKLKEVETLLLQSWDRLQQTDETPDPYLAEIIQHLRELYEQWNKPEQHAQWKERLVLLQKNKSDSEKGPDPGAAP